MGSRNAQGKTPRDIARDAGLQRNVEKIGSSLSTSIEPSECREIFLLSFTDAYCTELLEENNRQAIQDLLLAGYTDLIKAWSTHQPDGSDNNPALREMMTQFLVLVTVQ